MDKIRNVFVTLVTLSVFAVSGAAAQTSIPVSQGQAFLGVWTLNVEGTVLEMNIRDQGGQVAADVIVMGTTSKVTTIARNENALDLQYIAELEGQQAPVKIKLTPAGENMNAAIDVADGMFSVTATATRKPG